MDGWEEDVTAHVFLQYNYVEKMKSGFLLKSYPVQLEAVEVTEEVLPRVPLYKCMSICVLM